MERMGDEKLAKEQMPRSGREMEARKTEIVMCDCINSDLERKEEEWRKEQPIE